jgi:hypothetical protein
LTILQDGRNADLVAAMFKIIVILHFTSVREDGACDAIQEHPVCHARATPGLLRRLLSRLFAREPNRAMAILAALKLNVFYTSLLL